MEILEPRTWSELNDLLWRASYSGSRQKWTTCTAFRGVARRHGNLETSLQRLRHVGATNLAWRERRLLDTFRTHARPEFHYGTTDWDLMLLGQHHGLPTRLLDWTISPLAALFFVVHHDCKDDGEIWCVNRVETNQFFDPTLQELLKKQGGNMFTPNTLAAAFPSLEDFDKLSPQMILFFEPPGIDPRIINQYSIFSVMPGPETDTLAFLERHEEVCWTIVVPAHLKAEIRQRLLVMNVSDRTMYPGLDGIGPWLRSYYSQP